MTSAAPNKRRLFGTDGIRGVANVEPMTPDLALQLGRAIAHVLRKQRGRRRIVIGKDTRLSGYMLESALTSGICSMGADALLVGPVPTPGIAFLTRSLRADAGVVISASHNPYQDNGVKFFDADGFKLPDAVELQVEHLALDGGLPSARPTAAGIGRAVRIDDALGRYNAFVKQILPRQVTLAGVKIALDCAHGAAYRIAPDVLGELGAEVAAMGTSPDGENINRGCGAVHPQGLCDLVRREGAQLGIAFDGDADRCIFVDERGAVVDGDETLAMLALGLQRRGELKHATVVTTVMSNLGLEVALGNHGIRLIRTAVGDRYVLERMISGGFNLGGEQSGHIVQLDHTTTGDGLVTALSVLRLVVESGGALSELKRVIKKFPQVLLSVPVVRRADLSAVPGVAAVLRQAESGLGACSRVLVRHSGTESVVRIMVEGEQRQRVEQAAESIAAAVREHLG